MIADRASHFIDVLHRHIYAGPVERLVNKFGIQPYLAKGYWSLVLALSDDTHTRTAAGVDATYKITSPQEYNRFHDPTIKGKTEILRDLLSNLEPDDVFYDIGANVGLYSCFAGRKAVDGTAVAFEPHPLNVERIRENIELNNITATVCEVALADKDGSASLEVNDNTAGVVGNVSRDSNEGENIQIPIELRNGDEMVENGEIPVPNIVKIDVDGGEADVVRGLSETLNNSDCRRIYCEIHPSALEEYGSTPEEVHKILGNSGFELETIGMDHQMRKNAYFVCGSKI
jgi:FkbM family methyltransferase